jgi:hypothetical protein
MELTPDEQREFLARYRSIIRQEMAALIFRLARVE